MLRDQKTGGWRLSEASKHSIMAPEGRVFVHVHYNGLGSELAIADNLGVIRMYGFGHGVLSRAHHLLDDAIQSDGRSELDAIVGMHWLSIWPAEFRVRYMGAPLYIY